MGASLLVLLNKTDVEGSMTENEIREVRLKFLAPQSRDLSVMELTSTMQGLRLDAIKTHKWTILPCSAMTGMNLNEGLEWVVQDAKDRLFLY